MLKAKIKNGPYIFGLDAENIKRLTAGQPILINMEEIGGTGEIMIMYGETLSDIKNELESAMQVTH